MLKTKLIYIILIFTILLSGCQYFNRPQEEEPLARVGEKYLYKKDLKGLISNSADPQDSIQTAENYIDNWIQKQVVLQKAEENLPEYQLDVEKKLQEYRRSLIIHKYETELVRQNLDTIISDKQIKEYYENHKDEFKLTDNIVRVLYVKVRSDAPNQRQLSSFLRSDNPDEQQKLKEYCERYAVNYFLDEDSWLYFKDLLKEIPIETYNQENYLQNNRYIVEKDSMFNYYLYIKGFRIKESTSPLAFEKSRIRDIIINKRKMELVREMKESVLDEARKKNKIERYTES
ncbi:MAG: hypothetical protein K9I29_08140 [Bacteroidales bacterium]|nr:hypothetical protein [Bacteroidales bacterium]MCF8328252.1 hypothetical protein [Bacteroidales bacterium]